MRKVYSILWLLIGMGCFSISQGAPPLPDGGSIAAPVGVSQADIKNSDEYIDHLPKACNDKIDALIQEINQKYELAKVQALPLFSPDKWKNYITTQNGKRSYDIALPYDARMKDKFPSANGDLDLGGLKITGGHYDTDMGRCNLGRKEIKSSEDAAEVALAIDKGALSMTVSGCLLDSMDLVQGNNLRAYYQYLKLDKVVRGGGFFFAYPLKYTFDPEKPGCPLKQVEATLVNRLGPGAYIKPQSWTFKQEDCEAQVPSDKNCIDFDFFDEKNGKKIPDENCETLRHNFLKWQVISDQQCQGLFPGIKTDKELEEIKEPDPKATYKALSDKAKASCKDLQQLMDPIACKEDRSICDPKRRNYLAAKYQVCQKFPKSEEKPVSQAPVPPPAAPTVVKPPAPLSGQPINKH